MKKTDIYLYGSLTLISLLFLNRQIQISYLKKLARQDLDFTHQVILQNHPELNNNESIELAYNTAKKEIINIRSSTDQIKAFKNYIATFKDVPVCFYRKDSITLFATDTDETNTMDIPSKHVLRVTLPSNIGDLEMPTT